MPQAPNRLFSRAEIRWIIRERANELSMAFRSHGDLAHNPAITNFSACALCSNFRGELNALEDMYRHFGGRR